MDNLISDYTDLLKQVEDMDLKTLDNIKYMGNLKKKRTERKLAILKNFPKCQLTGRLIDKAIQSNLDLQSRLGFWTFLKIQETLNCENLKLTEEPKDNEEKFKIYDYFLHLILTNPDKKIVDIIGLDDRLLVIDEDNNLYCDDAKYSHLTAFGNNSFLKLVNIILENLGIDQAIDLQSKKMKNPDGAVIYANVNQAYYMCDCNELFNVVILNNDGTHRIVKINNYGNYYEVPSTSLKNYEKNKNLSRTK